MRLVIGSRRLLAYPPPTVKNVALPVVLVGILGSLACKETASQAPRPDADDAEGGEDSGNVETSLPAADASRDFATLELAPEAPPEDVRPDVFADQMQPRDTDSPYCKTIDNPAPMVAAVLNADPTPTPAGGTMVAGMYYLTSWIYYGGLASCKLYSYALTMVITPSSDSTGYLQETWGIKIANGGASTERYASTHKIVSDTQVYLSNCGSSTASESRGYTATANEILFFPLRYENCGTTVMVFTRQDAIPDRG